MIISGNFLEDQYHKEKAVPQWVEDALNRVGIQVKCYKS